MFVAAQNLKKIHHNPYFLVFKVIQGHRSWHS